MANQICQFDDESFHEIRQSISTDSPVIVDGGAHRGRPIQGFLNSYPAAEIHVLDSNPALVDGLKKEFNGGNTCIFSKPLVPEAGTKVVNISAASPESSLRPSSPEVVHPHGDNIDR